MMGNDGKGFDEVALTVLDEIPNGVTKKISKSGLLREVRLLDDLCRLDLVEVSVIACL